MFVLTAKVSKTKIAAIVTLVIALVVAVALLALAPVDGAVVGTAVCRSVTEAVDVPL